MIKYWSIPETSSFLWAFRNSFKDSDFRTGLRRTTSYFVRDWGLLRNWWPTIMDRPWAEKLKSMETKRRFRELKLDKIVPERFASWPNYNFWWWCEITIIICLDSFHPRFNRDITKKGSFQEIVQISDIRWFYYSFFVTGVTYFQSQNPA